MKYLKFITMAMCCVAAMVFTSCNSDDDGPSALSKQEFQQTFNMVKGSYEGKLYWPVVNDTTGQTKADSTSITWEVSRDSSLTIHNFPTKLLGNYVTDSVVKKAIQEQKPTDITCQVVYTQVTPPTFILSPVTPQFSVTYGGASHKIAVPFWAGGYYSYGGYTAQSRRCSFIITEAAVFIDGKDSQMLKKGVTFILDGYKK